MSSDVRARIDRYRTARAGADDASLVRLTRKALGDRHYLLVTEAAGLGGERLLYDLEPDLLAACRRLLDKPAKADPGCTAKGAIARALVNLDCQDVDFFLAGMTYRQPEPVWGGTVDTATDFRASCAMGLVGTPYPRALVELAVLLHDPEARARSGAVRAVSCTEPLPAEALLRSKALAGDPEPEVTGECLRGLLSLAPDASVGFVAGFLDDDDPLIRELAALALGESRLDAALEVLRGCWDEQPLKREADRVLLRAAVLHRGGAALDWLLSVVESGDRQSAELVVRELADYRANEALRERVRAAVEKRKDSRLGNAFREGWNASGRSNV